MNVCAHSSDRGRDESDTDSGSPAIESEPVAMIEQLATSDARTDEYALLATIVEAAPFAILVVNEDGGIVFANRGAEAMFGYEHAQLLAMGVDALVPPHKRGAHSALRAMFLRHPSQRPMARDRTLNALRKDGRQVAVEIGLKPIQLAGTTCVLCVVVDVTERRRLERSVRQAHEELELRIRERTAELARANAEKERLVRDLEAKTRDLERLSLEDPLTGLSNRRDFDRHVNACIRHAQRHGSPMTVAMFDLDLFKLVNDRFGHALGDEVLKRVAEIMRQQCRAIDVISRYGGEEFALVFPDVETRAATAICERIRCQFERFDWTCIAPGLALTISAGVAGWSAGQTGADVLEVADRRLYVAKRGGRNRVVCEDAPS